MWLCECECGNRKIISKKALKSGIKGCGCILSSTKSGYKRKSERLYAIYNGIKERCLNKNNENYDLYGGRGISICDEWMGDNGYANFRTWALNNGYKNELTIDRIDVNGNYEPSNCRWATMKTQMNNRRNSIKININGQEMTLSDIADEYGISRGTVGSRYRAGCVGNEIIFGKDLKKYEVDGRLYTADEISNVFGIPKRQFASRLGKGWSVEKAATFPYKSFVEKEIEYNGEKHTINEWSEITGIKHQTLRWRINQGWDIDKIFDKGVSE